MIGSKTVLTQPSHKSESMRLAVILLELLENRHSLPVGAAKGELGKHHTEPKNEGRREENKSKRWKQTRIQPCLKPCKPWSFWLHKLMKSLFGISQFALGFL